jgi:hypothetical protein
LKIRGIELDGRILLNLLVAGRQPENKSYLHDKFILFAWCMVRIAGRSQHKHLNPSSRAVVFDQYIIFFSTLSRSAGTVRVDTPITAVDAIDVIGDFRESSKLGGRVTLKLSDSFNALPDEVRKAAEDAGGWLLIVTYNHRFRRR